ncbi:MAG TPA: glycosyltransferase family 2 protein [Candidatus Saccharimonadia bacterium]|nr:glycosyltransferase family 2 protein [Candidatus Saccharimonadia bacterium]
MNATIPLVANGAAPRFSVVIPHYDGAISDELLLRGLASLGQQTFADFEVLLFHDGPQSRPWPDLKQFPLKLRIGTTPRRFNDWGHSLRDLGIQHAHGDYIVHFNPDNVLYPHALEVLDRASREPVEPAPDPDHRENPEVLVFAVLMRGMRYNGRAVWRDRTSERYMIMQGYPPQTGLIDCMQAVITRSLWHEIGGWYDKREASDGTIYGALIINRGARYIPEVLGEHW